MDFIVHAAGSMGNRPDLGKKGYRMKCRFRIEPRPTRDHLKRSAAKAMEWFIKDMRHEGWEHWPQGGIRLNGPFVPVAPVTIQVPRRLTARQMLPAIRQGARFLDTGGTAAPAAGALAESEFWEYELALVFYRDTILMESPDPHEERRR